MGEDQVAARKKTLFEELLSNVKDHISAMESLIEEFEDWGLNHIKMDRVKKNMELLKNRIECMKQGDKFVE